MNICANMDEPAQTDIADAVMSQKIGSELKLTSPAMPQKYVSVFHIDGVPIIPPLLTTEKRRQMQKFKEKAMRVEQRLEENRRRKLRFHKEYTTLLEEQEEDTQLPANNSSCDSSISETQVELDVHQKEVEDSYLLLTNLIQAHANESNIETTKQNIYLGSRTRGGAEVEPDNESTTEAHSSDSNLLERMQKLRKSETLIYDNRSNTLILPMMGKESEQQLEHQNENLNKLEDIHIGRKAELRDVEEKANLNYLTLQKPMSFSMEKTLKDIPSISVDPPTPLVASRSFGEGLAEKVSADTIDDNVKVSANKNASYMDDLSSDDSYNSMQSTTNLEHDLKAHRKVTNITSKILKFEHYAVVPVEKESPKVTVGMKPPQRSATSPSLKPLSDCSPMHSLEVVQKQQTENGLVRSNSFTLDYPSKALIEHIRQQQVSQPNYPTKRCNMLSHSATRDTVESKAKRVQKVESKSRSMQMRLQTKASSTNITSPSHSYPTSNTLLFKSKRSPYENKTVVKSKIGRQLKKSVSGTSAIKQVKPRPSMPSIQIAKSPNDKVNNAPPSETKRQNLGEIEAEHRQKFLQLLAKQKAEQQRMQQVFEEQQQLLLEQLTVKIGNVHMHGTHMNKLSAAADNSATAKSDCSDMPLRSPTLSVNSSILSSPMCVNSTGVCELSSLELSACTTLPTSSLNSSRCTPRRRLFTTEHAAAMYAHNVPLCSAPSNSLASVGPHTGSVPVAIASVIGGAGLTSTNVSPNSTANSTRRRSADSLLERAEAVARAQRRTAAVTKINAHVRGYLVRRLFQTEQIQRIVQTIHDTLIFVLNLHVETLQDPVEARAPENVQLKVRLLQQLNSATHTLHLVLFQTSVKERMDIISRDRKRIKTKMLSMNLKRPPRIMA